MRVKREGASASSRFVLEKTFCLNEIGLGMQQVYEKNARYERWLPFVNWMIRHLFRSVRYVGRDRLPQDGAIIFSPNHVDALCDALAVLAMDNHRKVFAARADIFRKPRVAKILHWLKIIPIRRIRDGLNEVRQNDETISLAVETLQHDVPFCMMPEGTHRPKHSLMPLSKGIFRIALNAVEAIPDKPVYIVPVGLEYADFFHLWDNLVVQIGEPINVTRFVSEHTYLDRPQMMLALREDLTRAMQEVILWVPDDEHYDENWHKLMLQAPAPFDELRPKRISRPLVLCLLVLCLPFFLISGIMTMPLWIARLIIHRKVQDPAFWNSVQLVLELLLIPCSLFILYPFRVIFDEYLYWCRRLCGEFM